MDQPLLFAPEALRDHVVLVAGASGGLGRAITTTLARTGARLLLTARRAPRLRDLADDLLLLGRAPEDIDTLPADLRSDEGAPGVVARALDRFGRLDAVVNAAGVGLLGPFTQHRPEAWWDLIHTNVGAALRLAHAAAPALAARRGRFIQLTSGLGRTPRKEAAAYAASQHALHALIHGLRLEYGAQGVRFSTLSIAGAGVDTPFWDRAAPRVDRAGMLNPEDVAQAVAFALLTPDRAHVDELNIRTV